MSTKKEIHTTSGDGRWVNHAVYTLCDDGSVAIESWLEDEDWSGSSREREMSSIMPLDQCPDFVIAKFNKP